MTRSILVAVALLTVTAAASLLRLTDLEALVAGAAQPDEGPGFSLYRIGDAVAS